MTVKVMSLGAAVYDQGSEEQFFPLSQGDEGPCVLKVSGVFSGTEKLLARAPYVEEGRIPTVKEWITELKQRKWANDRLFISHFYKAIVSGSCPDTHVMHEEDRSLLQKILRIHNKFFDEIIKCIPSVDAGYIQKKRLNDKSFIYFRGDLHTDIATAISQLDALRKGQGLIDNQYRIGEKLLVIFGGDYGGRGINDLEMYILILLLRLENPQNFIPLRGNHEDTTVQAYSSSEGEWFVEKKAFFEACYKSFPLAVCVAGKRNSGKEQIVHFSHGLFSPSVDLDPLWKSQESHICLPELPLYTERLLNLKNEETSLKLREAFIQLDISVTSEGRVSLMYCWGDPGEKTRPVKGGHDMYSLSVDDIQGYARIACSEASVKAFLFAHQHEYNELMTSSKKHKERVIGTIMPKGSISGFYDLHPETRQGMLFQVAEKVSDWTKQFVVCLSTLQNGMKTRSDISQQVYKMYERTLS